MRLQPSTVTLSEQAAATLRAKARTARHREVGGILVGYRIGSDLHVQDALTVPDVTAAPTSYLRRERPGQAVLDTWLQAADDPDLSYVGEWHTHPQPEPPSATDHRATRQMAAHRRGRDPLVVIVAANDPARGDVRLHALTVAATRGILRRLDVEAARVVIDDR